jgi:hypothetical protein
MALLSDDLKLALCPKPCRGPMTWGERRIMLDGTEQLSGDRRRPLCDLCPEWDNPKGPPITHIEVVLDERGGDSAPGPLPRSGPHDFAWP